MSSDLILRQIRGGESLHVEFKASTSPRSNLARVVCSFLNTEGGTVFCGVDDLGKVVGVENAEDERLALEQALQRAISPTALFTLSVELVSGLPLVVVEVPEGKDRPYVVDGAVFVRQGAVTRAADARTLRSLVQDQAAARERWERRPATLLELEDLDRDEIERTVVDARTSGRLDFQTPDDTFAVLGELSMVTATGLTQAAEVAFALHPARRHPQCKIRVVRYASEKTSDHYLDDRSFDGPLVRTFDDVFESMASHVRVHAYFPLESTRREIRPQYAVEALREGLVNAIAHRDYSSFSGGVTISIYPSRIEIWNSGRLPAELVPADLKQVHPSIPTNPDISHVLYLRRLMERVGRGTQKIIAASKELGAPGPRWSDRPSGVTLTIFAATKDATIPLDLNVRQRELLRQLSPGDVVQPLDYAASVADRVSIRQARRDLSLLEEAGLLERRGAARATHYARTDRDVA
ncbi:MAG: ATP-dependent helicase RecG [Sphingomonadales bacterium]|jgi:ATP-dependent DNA helicase RecG|nr:ATP-dependent helicase RecG [Sphingomonadales bacterium]